MGYRQYFYEVDRSIVEGIRKCKTEEELYDFCIKNEIKCNKYEYDGKVEYYLPVYKLGKNYLNLANIMKTLMNSINMGIVYSQVRS